MANSVKFCKQEWIKKSVSICAKLVMADFKGLEISAKMLTQGKCTKNIQIFIIRTNVKIIHCSPPIHSYVLYCVGLSLKVLIKYIDVFGSNKPKSKNGGRNSSFQSDVYQHHQVKVICRLRIACHYPSPKPLKSQRAANLVRSSKQISETITTCNKLNLTAFKKR